MVVVVHAEMPGCTHTEIELWRHEVVLNPMMVMMLILDPNMVTP